MTSVTERSAGRPGRRGQRRLVAAAFAVLLAVALLSSGLTVRRYVRTSAAFCEQCHATQEQFLLWEQGVHHDLACQECHEFTESQSLDLLLAITLGQPAGTKEHPHSPAVPVARCAGCHFRGDELWPQIAGTRGHEVHLDIEDVSCKSCHARSIHRFAAAEEACIDCHEQRTVHGLCMEEVSCISCHNFLSRGEDLRPPRSACNECHESHGVAGMEQESDHGHTSLPCWECHVPHKDLGETVQIACNTCHTALPETPEHEGSLEGGCLGCHVIHHIPEDRKR